MICSLKTVTGSVHVKFWRHSPACTSHLMYVANKLKFQIGFHYMMPINKDCFTDYILWCTDALTLPSVIRQHGHFQTLKTKHDMVSLHDA